MPAPPNTFQTEREQTRDLALIVMMEACEDGETQPPDKGDPLVIAQASRTGTTAARLSGLQLADPVQDFRTDVPFFSHRRFLHESVSARVPG